MNLLTVGSLLTKFLMTSWFLVTHSEVRFLQRKISHKEDERINQAVVLIRRATWLPVSFAMRKQIIAAAPLSKAEFGWMA